MRFAKSKHLLLLLGIGLLMNSCISGADKKVNNLKFMMLKGPSALSMMHLVDSVSEFAGLPIDYQIYNEPNQIRARLLQEEADMAMVPTNLAAILYNRNLPYRLVMVPVWGTLYVCGSDTTIHQLKDLSGKRVFSMARGMNPDIILRCLLEKNDLRPEDDVYLDYSFPSHIDLANAVKAGRADLAILSEPMISLILDENPEINILVDLNDAWNDQYGFQLPQTAVLVHEKILQKTDAIQQLIREMEWSARQAVSDTDKTARLAVELNILPKEDIILNALPRCHILPVSGLELKPAMDAYLRVFYNFNPQTIGGKLPDEGFIYN